MFSWLKRIFDNISSLSSVLDEYKKDTVIQSLPTLTYVNRAKKFIDNNDFISAEKLLLEALELPQKDPLVYKYLGVVYEKTAKHDLAVENYQASADLNPHDKIIWQRLGFELVSIGKYEQAEKAFDNSNKVQAGNSDTFMGWGMSLMKQKKYDEAREKFAQAAQLNKYNFSAVFLCAVNEIKLKMYDKAESKLSFLANVAPNEGNTFEYARLKALKNDYDSAIHYAKKSLEYNSKMLPAYILLGQLYAQMLDKENSLNSFLSAEKMGLDNFNLYLEWGKVLEKFELLDEAEEKLNKALLIDEQNIDVKATLGLCYVLKKDFCKAEPLLRDVQQFEPENNKVKQALGIIAYEQGDFDEAISIFRADDEDAVNCYYLAKCYENKNDDTKVKDYYETALRQNPKYTVVYKDYSRYLIDKNEYGEAQRKLRKALKYDENNIDLLNLMFYVSYILVKADLYEYNVKETLAIAHKIESVSPDLFKYPGQKQELIELLSERD